MGLAVGRSVGREVGIILGSKDGFNVGNRDGERLPIIGASEVAIYVGSGVVGRCVLGLSVGR